PSKTRRIVRSLSPIALLACRVKASRRTSPLRHRSPFTGLQNSLPSYSPWNTARLLAYRSGSTVVACLQVLVNSGKSIREFLPFGLTLIYDDDHLSTSALMGKDIRCATACIPAM